MATVGKHKWSYKGVERTNWIVRYTDQGGRRRGKTFERKKDADKFRTRVEAEIENAQHVPDRDTVTVRSLINQYLGMLQQRIVEGRLGRASAGNVEIALRKHLAPALGGMKIKDVTALDVERWHRSLLNRLSPSTAKETVGRAAAMESYAEKRGFTRCKAFRGYSDEVKGIKKQPIRTFTRDEVVHLLRTVEQRPPRGMFSTHLRMRCFVHLAAFCGMRFGEIAGLTVDDIVEAGFIRVRHSLTQLDELKGPKTRAGVRDVPVPMETREILREWLATRYVENERHLVFLTRGGKGFRPSYFHDSWHDLLERAGLERKGDQFHFHALRHFAASGYIDEGLFSLPDVASLLGHEKFDTTLQVYAHPIVGGNRRQSIVQQFASGLLGASMREAGPADSQKKNKKTAKPPINKGGNYINDVNGRRL